jgi:hypothetical protein
MYSYTWPNKCDFWKLLFDGIEGRLGLFLYQKRIISTLRKKQIDSFDAVSDLLNASYEYNASDYENLLKALQNGTLSPTGKCYTAREIADLWGTKQLRNRYGKYLRKQLREPVAMVQMLDGWFCKYKVTSSTTGDPNRRACGRLDPIRQVSLFTQETKTAVLNCKEKAKYLGDPLPLEEMYDCIKPNPNSEHQLTEYLSKRGESKLEAFHDRFAHFANSGMRRSLVDNLNLCGTARRYNLTIRHKQSFLSNTDKEERIRIPASWEKVVAYYNHSELWYVNGLAASVGVKNLPFPNAKILPADTGECFFSDYLDVLPGSRFDDYDCCICPRCIKTPQRIPTSIVQTEPAVLTNQNAALVRQQNTQHPAPTAIALPPTPETPNKHTPTTQNFAVAPTQNFTFPYQQNHSLLPIQPHIIPALPLYIIPPSFCCKKYMEWTTVRRGRPPHDRECTRMTSIAPGWNWCGVG